MLDVFIILCCSPATDMRCWTAAVRHVRGCSDGGDGDSGASRDGETPLPVQPMRVVFLVQFSEAFQHSVLFPFVPFMVASMPSVPEADVGTYVGLVVASFSLGQLVSSYPWGWTAQRFGTKAVVVTSLGTSALCTLVFGFSTSFAMAFSTRFAAGLTNSIMGCVKAYLGRITDASNQSRAMAVMAAASTVGGILGPTVGGLLAAPPAAPGSPLALFPFMLPCIITAVCMLGACVYAAAAMQEPGEVQRRAAAAAEAAAAARDASSCYELVGADACETAVADDDDDVDANADADDDARAVEDGSVMRPPAPAAEDEKEEESPLTLVSSSSGSVAILVTPTTEDGGRPDGLLLTRRRPSLGLGQGGSAQRLLSFVSEADTEKGDDDDLAVNTSDNADVGPRKRTMWFAAAMYGYVALCFVILDETYPVFCRESEANGGLGFTSVEIGVVGSITACLSIVYNLLAYPRLAKAYGLMVRVVASGLARRADGK